MVLVGGSMALAGWCNGRVRGLRDFCAPAVFLRHLLALVSLGALFACLGCSGALAQRDQGADEAWALPFAVTPDAYADERPARQDERPAWQVEIAALASAAEADNAEGNLSRTVQRTDQWLRAPQQVAIRAAQAGPAVGANYVVARSLLANDLPYLAALEFAAVAQSAPQSQTFPSALEHLRTQLRQFACDPSATRPLVLLDPDGIHPAALASWHAFTAAELLEAGEAEQARMHLKHVPSTVRDAARAAYLSAIAEWPDRDDIDADTARRIREQLHSAIVAAGLLDQGDLADLAWLALGRLELQVGRADIAERCHAHLSAKSPWQRAVLRDRLRLWVAVDRTKALSQLREYRRHGYKDLFAPEAYILESGLVFFGPRSLEEEVAAKQWHADSELLDTIARDFENTVEELGPPLRDATRRLERNTPAFTPTGTVQLDPLPLVLQRELQFDRNLQVLARTLIEVERELVVLTKHAGAVGQRAGPWVATLAEHRNRLQARIRQATVAALRKLANDIERAHNELIRFQCGLGPDSHCPW
jgi:hypothetical protein